MKQVMQLALKEAQRAYERDEVPVGAVIVDGANGKIIASAGNMVKENKSALAHAEILVIQEASQKLGSAYLSNCDIYVTLEPCSMCASAISLARLRRLYFGAYDPKSGGTEHGACIFNHDTCHHKPEIYGGICEQACSELLSQFFQEKRQ